jgi:pimeloyl-ACP methyl ester carboxylesterase
MKNITIILTFFVLVSCTNQNNGSKEEKPMTTTADSTGFKSGYSEVNGLNMYYEMHGNTGEYLVLIHGGGSTIGTSFGTILPMLAPNHKVIAVELQAHGHTSDRNTPESFEQDADDVAALLHNLQISKASFFGFSNGGNTAMQIAIRHLELVNKLVIASAFYKREGMFPGFFDMMKGATINDMPQLLKDAYLKINPDTNGLMAMFTKDRDRMINFKDWPDEMLRSIKAPSLILSGDRDVASNRHTVEMAGLIEGSRLVILPAAHGAYIGVAESPDSESKLPEMTVQIVDEFLKKQ